MSVLCLDTNGNKLWERTMNYVDSVGLGVHLETATGSSGFLFCFGFT